ncbi:hypothetical protein PTKIN_Ptkin03bG0021500 [Pterospermum kingtungense]
MNGNWPSDMLTEILLKLPVKSIIRFKCVAKTWCHLFQNPTFISQHLSVSKKNHKRLVVYYWDGNNDNFVMRLFVDQALDFYHDLHRPSHFASIYRSLVFCVDNGLFCLLDAANSILALWNPATTEFKILPQCNQNIPSKISAIADTLGFGLVPLSNDYKVVYIRSYLDLEKDMEEPAHIAIYSMSSDSWRVFEDEEVEFFRDNHICGNFNNACVNGVYYWHTFKSIDDSGYYDHKVLALNLGTEVFRLIDLPFSKRGGHLIPLHDRIAIWDTDLLVDIEISNEVWVLDDDGRNWTKVLKIEIPVLQVQRMFGFWKNNKVLVESVTGQLLLYDLEKEEAKELGIQTKEDWYFLFVHTYEESLVAIGNE